MHQHQQRIAALQIRAREAACAFGRLASTSSAAPRSSAACSRAMLVPPCACAAASTSSPWPGGTGMLSWRMAPPSDGAWSAAPGPPHQAPDAAQDRQVSQ
jgi:hypothetical protein